MNLVLQRMAKREGSSYGVIFLDGIHQCFTIEDGHREVKINGETRIPKGEYEIRFRGEVTPLTEKYRNKFDWFTYHLEIQDIVGFTNCYLHIGNRSSDSEGCPLVNSGVTEVNGEFIGSNSTGAYTELYKLVSDVLNKGEQVFISIRDEDYAASLF